MLYIVQPYVFWKGHFKQYFLNLLSDRNFYIYCNREDLAIANSKFIKSWQINYEKSFSGFILARLIHSIRVVVALVSRINVGKDSVHFIEFEPISFFVFESLTFFRKKKVVITIHSIRRIVYQSTIRDLISRAQRWLFSLAVRYAARKGYNFVVHYKFHEKQLLELIGGKAKVTLIDYPSPSPLVKQPKQLNGGKLLIYGQIREDKGIYDFLLDKAVQRIPITVAGRILDRRILDFHRENLTIIDDFISEQELAKLFGQCDFLLLPYGRGYAGGAGPLKDSFAYATPVICSDLEIFKEIVLGYDTGLVYENPASIAELVEHIDNQRYRQLSENCLNYARNNDWGAMREKYFALYEGLYEC